MMPLALPSKFWGAIQPQLAHDAERDANASLEIMGNLPVNSEYEPGQEFLTDDGDLKV